jgi:hypothetical protein
VIRFCALQDGTRTASECYSQGTCDAPGIMPVIDVVIYTWHALVRRLRDDT